MFEDFFLDINFRKILNININKYIIINIKFYGKPTNNNNQSLSR